MIAMLWSEPPGHHVVWLICRLAHTYLNQSAFERETWDQDPVQARDAPSLGCNHACTAIQTIEPLLRPHMHTTSHMAHALPMLGLSQVNVLCRPYTPRWPCIARGMCAAAACGLRLPCSACTPCKRPGLTGVPQNLQPLHTLLVPSPFCSHTNASNNQGTKRCPANSLIFSPMLCHNVSQVRLTLPKGI